MIANKHKKQTRTKTRQSRKHIDPISPTTKKKQKTKQSKTKT